MGGTFSSNCISLVFHTSVQVTFLGGLCIIIVIFKCHSSCFLLIYCCILLLLFHFSWLGSHLRKSPARNVVCFNISPCTVYEPITCHSYDLYIFIYINKKYTESKICIKRTWIWSLLIQATVIGRHLGSIWRVQVNFNFENKLNLKFSVLNWLY